MKIARIILHIFLILLVSLTSACGSTPASTYVEHDCTIITDQLEKNGCWRGIAMHRRDLSICTQIVDVPTTEYTSDYTQQGCVEAVKKELGLQDCEQFTDTRQKDVCLINKASRLRQTSYCDQMSEGPTKEGCYRAVTDQ